MMHINELQSLLDVFYVNLLLMEENGKEVHNKFADALNSYKNILDANFSTELEYFESLQDISMLEIRVNNYRNIMRSLEDDRSDLQKELKKLRIQKRSYEEVIHYFQYEVRVMSEQLLHLQEILTMSNETTQVETAQLTEAVDALRHANEELCGRLCGAEQRCLLETQMNQINETRIDELQELLCQKNLEIQHFECAVQDMKDTLENTLKNNQHLEEDVCNLNCKIILMDSTIKAYEQEHAQHLENNQSCQSQINFCEKNLCELKKLLDEKNESFDELRTEYNTQYNILVTTQNEMMQLKDSQEDRQLRISELSKALLECQDVNKKMHADVQSMKHKLKDLAKTEATKDNEIKQYQNVIGELKKALIDLNQNLAQTEIKSKCSCTGKDKMDKEHRQICKTLSSCQCEIASYAQITEDLKQLVSGLRDQLNEKDMQIKKVDDECKKYKIKIADFCKKECKRDKEQQDLVQALSKSHDEEKRLKNELNNIEKEILLLKDNIKQKDEQLNSFRANLQQIQSGKDVVIQQETSSLHNKIETLQAELRAAKENTCNKRAVEELQVKLSKTLEKVADLERQNLRMKEQLEEYLIEIERLQTEKELIEQKSEQLNNELQSLKCVCNSLKRQNRYNNDVVKNLERELIDIKNHRDDISIESRHVVDNVKLWLQEQKNINEQVTNKMKHLTDTIEKLQLEKESLCDQMQTYQVLPSNQSSSSKSGDPSRHISTPQRYSASCRYSVGNNRCERSPSPWSLGSQGSVSITDPRESLCGSPSGSPYHIQDWYSSYYKDREITDDEDEEGLVARVESLTAQFQRANKTWKNKMQKCRNAEYCVSKDDK